MPNTRRNNRRNTRKNRRNGVFGYVYRPVGHVISAANESVGAIANTGKGLISTTFRGVNKVGRSVTGHLNMAVSGLLKPISGKTRRNRRANRKSRRNNTRRNNY